MLAGKRKDEKASERETVIPSQSDAPSAELASEESLVSVEGCLAVND